MTLRPEIRAILNRTRLARIALDAQLGIMPAGVARFMADENDKLAEGLSDEDLTFLKHADGLQGPYGKIQLAKALIREARDEIRKIVGGQLAEGSVAVKKKTKPAAAPKTKAKTKAKDVKFSADGGEELSHDEKLVYDALTSAGSRRSEIEDATNLKASSVKRVLDALAARSLAAKTGAGPATRWMKL